MNKKVRNIIIVLAVLVVCVIAYLVILNVTKEDKQNTDNGTAAYYLDLGDANFTSITLENENETIGFSYNNDNSSWTYNEDKDFPVNQTTINLMLSYIKDLSYTRTISDVNDLSIYHLDNPALKLSYSLSDDRSQSLLISEIGSGEDTFYFCEEGSNTIFLSSSKLDAYVSYGLYDFMQLVSIPPFKTYRITSAEFDAKDGEYVKVFFYPNENTNDSFGYIAERNIYMSAEDAYNIWMNDFDSPYSKYLLPVSIDDTDIMKNYINEFIINRGVNYKPTEQELEAYGLLEPQTVVTLEFSVDLPEEKTKVVTDKDATSVIRDIYYSPDHIYKISVGYPTSESKGEYYVMVSCENIDGSDSQYNSPAVYTANAIYCEYYLEMCANNINGVNSSNTLDDEEIPMLSIENLDRILIQSYKYSDETKELAEMEWLDIYFDDNSSLLFDYQHFVSETSEITGKVETPVSRIAANQLFEYVLNSNQLKYTETIVKDVNKDTNPENEKIYDQYGLLYPSKHYIFYYGETQWALAIGTDDNDYYVTASNSKCIYKMSDSMLNYFLALDKDILSGEKVYGKTEINSDN